MEDMNIPDFYADKNVFITGVTGFVGKVFVEKVLRSCPNIEGVYCLIRPKKGLNGVDRLHTLLQEKLYGRLRDEQPDFENKIHVIDGDCMEDNLGMKQDDIELLNSKIHIVFHCAATIKFNEHLRVALDMNVLGVRRMINLAREFKNLKVFVHVSTAFSNCEKQLITEEIYPAPIEPQKLIDAFKWMDDEMISKITDRLIGEKPNTYTYTKQLAEHLLVQEGGDLPLAIVRPSIVTAAWREPYPGWIDNINGPSGVYIAIGKGLLRSTYADKKSLADCIPVDLLANSMLTIAWYTAVRSPPQNALVYNITSINPLEWGTWKEMLLSLLKRIPYESGLRRPKCRITRWYWLHRCHVFFSHTVVAHLLDKMYVLMGKRPRMVYIYSKLQKSMETLEYFTLRSWEWTHANLDVLCNEMKPEDFESFYIDPRHLNWDMYLENYVIGTKKYILKEDLTGVPAAKLHLKKLRNLSYIFNTVFGMALWWYLRKKSNIAMKSWNYFMELVYKCLQFFKISKRIASKTQ